MSERGKPELESQYQQQVDSGGAPKSAIDLAMAGRIPWLEVRAHAYPKTEERSRHHSTERLTLSQAHPVETPLPQFEHVKRVDAGAHKRDTADEANRERPQVPSMPAGIVCERLSKPKATHQ